MPEVPACCKVPPGAEAARRVLTYAHKLSYTTFAPVGFEPGKTPLGNFRPPAPQEWQMRMSQLHQFAGDSARLATQRDRLSEQRRQWEASLPMAVHTLRNHALMCCDAEGATVKLNVPP